MKMNNKSGTAMLFIAILLLSMAFVPAVSAQEEVIDQKLTFSPNTFEDLKKSPNILTTYGKMPSFGNSEQREKWLTLLQNVSDNVRDNPNYNISDYMYPKGPIVGYGYGINGYLFVNVDKDLEKTLMDYIYGTFDQQAQVIGIKEVPLVFESGEVPREDLSFTKKNLHKDENSTNQQAETNQQKSKEKTNSVPDFSSMCGLSGLYLAYKIRH